MSSNKYTPGKTFTKLSSGLQKKIESFQKKSTSTTTGFFKKSIHRAKVKRSNTVGVELF
jgi:hypothetical protein